MVFYGFAPSAINLDVLIHTFSGVSAGAIATLTLHPVDLVKTRFQAQDGTVARRINNVTYTSTLQAFRCILKSEGIPALYQGMTPALLGGTSGWGLYFGCYKYLKAMLPEDLVMRNFIAATSAGCFSSILTCPIWLIKTRMQLLERTNTGTASMSRELQAILSTQGVTGLFRGLVPQLWLVLNPAIQLTVYEHLKSWAHAFSGHDTNHKLPDRYLTGCIIASKTIATTLTTPLSVIKVRMQDPRNHSDYTSVRYQGMLQSASTIMQREGPKGFFRGLVPTLGRTLPGALVTFLSYESISHALKDQLQNGQ